MAKKKVFQISDALTEGLEETITAAQSYSGELRIDVIPIRKIEVDPENPRDFALGFDDLYHGLSESDVNYSRKLAELASLQTIANSIQDQGIINPVVVFKYGEKYRLIAGERRTLASILAGKSDIQAKILESKPNELKVRLLQWIENVERSDLSLWERLKNLEKIVDAYTTKKNILPASMTITELSNLIGCTKPHAMSYKAVLFADDTLKNLIRDNQIKNLEKAALIANIASQITQQNAIQACLSGATLKKLKIIAKQTDHHSSTKMKMKPLERRGRQSTIVNLGATKNIKVARIILDSILSHQAFSHFTESFPPIDWNDYKSVTDTFKHILKKLELHA